MKANMLMACLANINNSEHFYECVAIPSERWNGWAMPYFTREVVQKIIDDCGVKVTKENETEIFTDDENEDPNYPLFYKDKHGWQVSGWIWDIVTKDKKQYIDRNGAVHDPHFDPIYDAIQRLEDMGGPEGQEYVDTLNRVIAECQQRIAVCRSGVLTGKPF